MIIGVVGFVLSLGLNTPIYELLRELVFTYRGLRAPARAAALVYLALAVLAAYGWRDGPGPAPAVDDRRHGGAGVDCSSSSTSR